MSRSTPDEAQQARDKRRYERMTLDAGIVVHDGERRRKGRVGDISGSGVRVRADSELESMDAPPDQGRYVDMDIAEISFLGGQVVRHLVDGYAVRFELDDDECRNLAMEIVNHRSDVME